MDELTRKISQWIPGDDPPEEWTYQVTYDRPTGHPATDKTPRHRTIGNAAWFGGEWWNVTITEKFPYPVIAYIPWPKPYQEDKATREPRR